MIAPCLFAFIVFLCILLIKPELSARHMVRCRLRGAALASPSRRQGPYAVAHRAFVEKEKLVKVRVVVGTDASALKIAQLFTSHDEWGIKIVGLLTGNGEEVGTKIGGFNILGRTDDLFSILRRNAWSIV